MTILTVADAKAHLNLTTDTDDALIGDKIAAAEAWIAAYIGADLEDEEVFEDGLPEPLKEAIRQLVAHFFENREASLVGVNAQELPFGLCDLLMPYRNWCF